MQACAVDECPEPARVRGWCQSHYDQWRRHGDPLVRQRRRRGSPTPECSVDGCAEPAQAKGRCRYHWAQDKYGTGGSHVTSTSVKPGQSGALHPSWKGTAVGYDGAHMRVKRLRGPASSHPCADCGSPARDWSLNASPRSLLVDAGGRRFSGDVNDYAPRCRRCHRALDRM